MVKIGIIDIPIFQVSLTLSYIRLVSDHSFPANLGYVRSSAKRASTTLDVGCPPSSPGSQFAQRNTTIHDAPTRGLPHWCTTSRSKWISTILQWRTCRNLSAYGPLQCTPTPANYEPEHRGNASRHTRKPTGKSHKLMRKHILYITEYWEQEVVLKLVNMRPEEIAMLPPTERASVLQLVRLDLSCGRLTHWGVMTQRASLGIH